METKLNDPRVEAELSARRFGPPKHVNVVALLDNTRTVSRPTTYNYIGLHGTAAHNRGFTGMP